MLYPLDQIVMLAIATAHRTLALYESGPRRYATHAAHPIAATPESVVRLRDSITPN
jgi:hypothetical protein